MTAIATKERLPTLRALFDTTASWNATMERINGQSSTVRLGEWLPLVRQVPPEELLAASLTPRGYNICHVMPTRAFRKGWRFGTTFDSQEPPPFEVMTLLQQVTAEYDLPIVALTAASCALTFGNALVFVTRTGRRGHIKQKKLRVVPIRPDEIYYDGEEIAYYRPQVLEGNLQGHRTIKPEEAVLWQNSLDFMGNGFQGVPALISTYLLLRGATSFELNYLDWLKTGGVAFLDVGINGDADQATLETWEQRYGDLTQPGNHAIFHDQNMTVKPMAAQSPVDFLHTYDGITKAFAAGTGTQALSLSGEQHGAVTGSEIDRDAALEGLSSLQERFAPYVVKLYHLVEPGLRYVPFSLYFDYEVRMGPQQKANLYAMFGQVVSMLPDAISINQVRRWLDLDPIKGPDGNLTYSQWVVKYGGEGDLREEPMDQQEASDNESSSGGRGPESVDARSHRRDPSDEQQASVLHKGHDLRTGPLPS
jgi:hypothetical protein